jgi:hypothetical protein
MSISFEFDAEAFRRNVLVAVIENAKEELRIRVSGIVCPEHHETPILEFGEESPESLQANIRGCCGEAVRMAKEAIGAEEDLSDSDTDYGKNVTPLK